MNFDSHRAVESYWFHRCCAPSSSLKETYSRQLVINLQRESSCMPIKHVHNIWILIHRTYIRAFLLRLQCRKALLFHVWKRMQSYSIKLSLFWENLEIKYMIPPLRVRWRFCCSWLAVIWLFLLGCRIFGSLRRTTTWQMNEWVACRKASGGDDTLNAEWSTQYYKHQKYWVSSGQICIMNAQHTSTHPIYAHSSR